MDANVLASIERLRDLSVVELQGKYKEVVGHESRSSNKQFLIRRIAWHMQAKIEGDLSERARRRAAEIVDDRDLRTRAPGQFRTRSVPANDGGLINYSRCMQDWRLPPPGTLITRRFGNRNIVVKVLEDGFEYESVRYRSLSVIARKVTGVRWNGFLFFGLGKQQNG